MPAPPLTAPAPGDMSAAVVAALQQLRADIGKDMDTQMRTLKDDLRREISTGLADVKDRQTEQASRLLSLEQWRVTQAERSSTQQVEVTREIAATQGQIKDQRIALDARTIAVFTAVLLSLLAVVLNVASHLAFR